MPALYLNHSGQLRNYPISGKNLDFGFQILRVYRRYIFALRNVLLSQGIHFVIKLMEERTFLFGTFAFFQKVRTILGCPKGNRQHIAIELKLIAGSNAHGSLLFCSVGNMGTECNLVLRLLRNVLLDLAFHNLTILAKVL